MVVDAVCTTGYRQLEILTIQRVKQVSVEAQSEDERIDHAQVPHRKVGVRDDAHVEHEKSNGWEDSHCREAVEPVYMLVLCVSADFTAPLVLVLVVLVVGGVVVEAPCRQQEG